MVKNRPTLEERKRLVALLEQLDWFFGTNVLSRTLRYQKEPPGDSPDCIADITVDEAYQRLSINIYPGFWEQDLYAQRKALLHEYCHYGVSFVQHVARELRQGKLVSDDQLIHQVERSTSFFENRIDALLRGRNRFMTSAYSKFTKPVKRLSPGKKKVKR